MHALLRMAILLIACATASSVFAQSLPQDPESLVQLLVAKSRPPLLRQVSDEERRLGLEIIEFAEKGPGGGRGALTEEACKMIESTLGPDLLDHLRPNNVLATQARSSDERVGEAIEALDRMGLKAFPALVAHCQDDRYSHVAISTVAFHQTVGGTCMEILAGQVNPRHAYKTCASYIGDKIHPGNAAEWWQSRSSRSLRKLRLEAIEWTLQEERKRITREEDSPFSDMPRTRVAELSKERERMLSEEAFQATGTRP